MTIFLPIPRVTQQTAKGWMLQKSKCGFALSPDAPLQGRTPRWLSLGIVAALAALPVQSQSQFARPTSQPSAPLGWKTQCVGRVLIDLPPGRPRQWDAQLDAAQVQRLKAPLGLSQFWEGVDAVRKKYAGEAQRGQPFAQGHYEKLEGLHAALVIGYADQKVGGSGAWAWRFVRLDEQHAYALSTQAAAPQAVALSPALLKPYAEKSKSVLQRLHPLRDDELPGRAGFCIDGAWLSGNVGKRAQALLAVEMAPGTQLLVEYLETSKGSDSPVMAAVSEAATTVQESGVFALTASAQPSGVKEVTVLRQQGRTLPGLSGQEVITQTTQDHGHPVYRFKLLMSGQSGKGDTQTLSMAMETADAPDSAGSTVGGASAPPSQDELMRWWDGALNSLKAQLPALPAGPELKAEN